MPRNYIVLRASPDWLRFDPQTSREFCARHGFPPDTVVDFVALWDAQLRTPYRRFREQLKRLSLETFRRVEGAQLLTLEAFTAQDSGARALEEDLFVFIDDDDWLAPDVFTRLRRQPLPDGALWGSIFLGKLVADTPVEKANSGVLQKRDFSETVFTNNYAVSGATLRRLGAALVFEHAAAQGQLNCGAWRPARVFEHLSLANKHPCCTVAAHYNMQSERFRREPRAVIDEFARELRQLRRDADIAWTTRPLHRFQRMVQAAAQGRLMERLFGR